jgi:hypothetical protein
MSPQLLLPLSPGDLVQVICHYTAEVANRRSLSSMEILLDDTIMQYINAATVWILCHTGFTISLRPAKEVRVRTVKFT